MTGNDPDREGGPDAEKPDPEPEPLDIDKAFAAIVAGWADDHPTTWPAQEDLTQGRHRRPPSDPREPGDPGPADPSRTGEGRRRDGSADRPVDRRTDGPAAPGPAAPDPSTPDPSTPGAPAPGSSAPGPATPGPATPGPADPDFGTPAPDAAGRGPARPDRPEYGTPDPLGLDRPGSGRWSDDRRPEGRRTGGRRAAGGRRRDDTDRAEDDLAFGGAYAEPLVPSVERPESGPEDLIDQVDAFVPPDPPMPRGDAITTLAWAGVVLGPLFLLFCVLFWRSVPQMLALAGLAGFIGGFITLVARLPRHRDDDDDDGAVV